MSNEEIFRNVVIVSQISKYLNSFGKDIVSLKLCNQSLKQTIEEVVPIHHIVNILQCCFRSEGSIPKLTLPTDFELKFVELEMLKNYNNYLPKKYYALDRSSIVHMVTKFILMFHHNSFCLQIFHLPFDVFFMMQLCEMDTYKNSSEVMKHFSIWKNLEHISWKKHWRKIEDFSLWEDFIKESHPSYCRAISKKALTNLDEYQHSSQHSSFNLVSVPDYLLDSTICNRDLFLLLLLNCSLQRYPVLDALLKKIKAHTKWSEYKTNFEIQLAMLYIFVVPFMKNEHNFSILIEEFKLGNWTDENNIQQLISNLPSLFKYLSSQIKNNKKIVMKAVKLLNWNITYANIHLQQDKDVVVCAMKPVIRSKSFEFFKDVYSNFQNDLDFILSLVKLNEKVFEYLPKEIQEDHNILLNLVSHNGKVLKMVSDKFKNDKEIVRAAVQQNGLAIKYSEFTHDKEIVRAAVQQNGFAIKYSDFRGDKDVALIAIKEPQNCENAFKKLREFLQDDEDIVMEFINSHGLMPDTMNDRFLNDMKLWKKTLFHNECALRFPFYKLKEKEQAEELIALAVKQNPLVLNQLKDEGLLNEQVIQLAKAFYDISHRK